MLPFYFQRRFNNLVIREREEMVPLWGDEFDDDDEDDDCVDALIGAFMCDYTHGPWKWSRDDFSDQGFKISNVTKEDEEKLAVSKKLLLKGKKRAREESDSEDDGEAKDAIANKKVEAIVGGLSAELKSGFHQVAENFKTVATQMSAMSDQMNAMTAQVSTLEQQVRKLRKKRARTSTSGFVHADLAGDDLEAGEKVTADPGFERKTGGDPPVGEGNLVNEETTPKQTPQKRTPTKEATPTKTPTKNPTKTPTKTPTKNPTPKRADEEDKSAEIEDKAAEKAKGKEKEGDPGARVSSLPSPSKPSKREPSKRIKDLKKVNE